MTDLYQFNFSQEVFSEEEIESALKLQELVKEKPHFNSDICNCFDCRVWRSNQSLVEQSQTTLKEEGEAD